MDRKISSFGVFSVRLDAKLRRDSKCMSDSDKARLTF